MIRLRAMPSFDLTKSLGGVSLTQTMRMIEWQFIEAAFERCGGNVTHAAAMLGIHRNTLQAKLHKPYWEAN